MVVVHMETLKMNLGCPLQVLVSSDNWITTISNTTTLLDSCFKKFGLYF